MKTMTQPFGLLVVSLLCASSLVACEDENNVTGRITVIQKMDVESTSGRDSIPVGTFNSELAMNEKGALLKVMPKGGYEGMIEVPFGGLKENQIGVIDIDSGTTRQSFAVKGEIKNESYRTTRSESETCVHHYERGVECRVVRSALESIGAMADRDRGGRGRDHRDRDRGGHEHRECHETTVTIYGRQDLERDVEITDKVINLGFVDGATGASLATYRGSYEVGVATLAVRYLGSCHL